MAMSMSPSTSGPVVGFETISSEMPEFSERKSRRIGMASRWANEVGSATLSTRFGRPFSLITSPSAWSIRSNDLDTTGRMCRPASVSTSCWGRRSNRATPRKFSSTMTCRLTALCATVRLLAAAVKLRCCPAASNALSALSGSHLRSIPPPRAAYSSHPCFCQRVKIAFIPHSERIRQYGGEPARRRLARRRAAPGSEGEPSASLDLLLQLSQDAVAGHDLMNAGVRLTVLADGGEELTILKLDAVHADGDLAHVDLLVLAGIEIVVAGDVGRGVADIAEEGPERPLVVERERQGADRPILALQLDAHVHGDAEPGVDRALKRVRLHDWRAALVGEQVHRVRGVMPEQMVVHERG